MQGERLTNALTDRVIVLLLVLVAGFVTYASTRSSFRLRVDMPPEFFGAPASSSPEKRAAEEKVARAYWYCVVTAIQRNYNFGDALPLDPPTEFMVNPNSAGGAKDPATRLRYWRRLQQIWYLPSIWTKERRWDFRWLTEGARSGGDRLHYYANKFVGG
jgi:hypothetical protein